MRDERPVDNMRNDLMIRTNGVIDTVPSGVSVIPENRLQYLVDKCSETLIRCPGNVLEVGVYKAGSLLKLTEVLKEICPQYKVYGIDTFSGHPYTDNHPVHPKGKYGDVEFFELLYFIRKKKFDDNVVLFEGKVEDIFKNLKLANISFAHIDCDLYIPIKYCALHVPNVLNKGSALYFDDYGHEHCPGATKAVEEVFNKTQFQEVYLPEDNTCWSCYLNF